MKTVKKNKTPDKSSIKPIEIIRYLFDLRDAAPIASWGMLITQAIFILLGSVVAPIFVAKLLAQIASGHANINASSHLLIGYGLVLFAGDIVMARLTIFFAYIGETKMQAKILKRMMSNLVGKSLDFHANNMSGEIISNSTKLYNAVEGFWDLLVFTVIPITTTIVAVTIALSFIFWQYAIVVFVLSLVIGGLIMKMQASIAPVSRVSAIKSSKVTAYFADVITNIAAVKAFSNEKKERVGHTDTISRWREAVEKEKWKVVSVTAQFSVLTAIMNIIAFFVAIFAAQHKLADIAIIYLVVNYTLSVVEQLWSVNRVTRNYLRIVSNASPMIETLQLPTLIIDPEQPEKAHMNRGGIRFENVKFRYPDSNDDQVLFENLNIKIQPGEKIGLVGKSGGGKTTLSKLLLRFMDIESGHIFIDNQDITAVKQSDLRSRIAYVPQEPMLFHRSIFENISYSTERATRQEVEAVAKMAHAHEFILGLPKGYDTLVGERGVKLSGGQRQRIAIARAMLKNAPILSMDEATSALDSESEALIQDALWKLMENRTAIVIAHRLSTIQKMDRIIVLDEGKIVEEGNHKYLIQQNGIYAKLWERQSGGFLED